MSVLIKGMEMPKDCPMCHFAHWDFTGEFRGCNAVNGKKYAMETEPGYPETNFRPSWCPFVPVPDHGRLIDALWVRDQIIKQWIDYSDDSHMYKRGMEDAYEVIRNAPTIIPAEGEDYEVPADLPVMYYPQVDGITPTIVPADKEGEG